MSVRSSRPGIEFRFQAAVHELGLEDGRLATFYVMDTGLNRNNWRVTDRALERALPSLVGKPLSCIPGYRVNHVHEPLRVGSWVKAEKPDGYALATAEVTDGVAWEMLRSGEWGPVSVVIRAYRVTCSFCGGDVTGAPDGHVLSGVGHDVVRSFVFERVDFVNEPAYPEAGLVDVIHAASGGVQTSLSKLDGAQGPQGTYPEPEEKMERKGMERIAELERILETVKAENRRLKAETEEYRGALRQVEEERHGELIERTLESRLRAGLARDRETEAARLGGLDESTLTMLAEDAEGLTRRTAAVPRGPRAKYTAGVGGFEEAVEEMRMRLFGHRREAGV